MALKDLKKILKEKPSYFKKGKTWLSETFDTPVSSVEKVLKEMKGEKKEYTSSIPSRVGGKKVIEEFFGKIKDKNPELDISYKETDYKPVIKKPSKTLDPNNVLFVGDLHAPFILDGYLEFNQELQHKYNCGTVIFAGDVIDGHSWSFHTHDVDGMSVKDELTAAVKQLKNWYKAFPDATILFGNHDLLIARKARQYGLSQIFLKYFGDVIEAPDSWKFTHEIYRDKVYYTHGSIGNAIRRATAMRHSVVQGHLHSECSVEWSVSEIDSIFGLQVGCGIDRKKYAFEYANAMTKKPIVSSGVILDKGTLPIVELMKL